MKKKKLILRNVFGKPVEIEGGSSDSQGGGIIVADENYDWDAPIDKPRLVYDSVNGDYLIQQPEGLATYLIYQPEKVVKVGLSDLGNDNSYDLIPCRYYIFLNDIKDSLKLLPLEFYGNTHTAEMKGRFTATIDSNSSFQLILPASIHIPDKYLTNNSLILEDDHTYEFSIMANIFMLTDVTSATLSDDTSSSGNDDPFTPIDPPTPGSVVNPGGGTLPNN